MNAIEEGDGSLRLVVLKVPNEMESGTLLPQVSKGQDLPVSLLDLVLAEVAESSLEARADSVGANRLADGHEGYVLDAAAGAGRRSGDSLPNGGHAVSDHFFGLRAAMSCWAVAMFWAFLLPEATYFSRRAMAPGVSPLLSVIVAKW